MQYITYIFSLIKYQLLIFAPFDHIYFEFSLFGRNPWIGLPMLVDFRGSITDTSIDLITFTFNHFHFYLQHQSPLPETSSEGYFIWFVVSVYVCVQFHDFWHILLCFRQIRNVARFLRENTDFEQQKHQLLTES